jgi:serine/threonine-protein kinase
MASPSLTLFDIVPGRKIADRYTVVGPSRQGGFSTAFEVSDDRGNSACELQLFPSGLFEGDGQVHEFHERLQPWMEIDSPAVLRVRDVIEIDADNLALVTALPQGESLRERLNRETSLPREEVIAIGRRLLEGLVAIHERDMVHGDIKPYTIHVQGTGADTRPVMVDGGVTPGLWTAKDLGEKTALIGTPYYAPVEQFGGDAPDVRSDIYNVATVLFECATGVLPWAGKTFLEIFQSKLSDPPAASERAPGVSIDRGLEAAIKKGCLADRNKRYATAAEFLEVLG